MSTRFYCYGGFTPCEMKTRTDIPLNQCDMSVGSTYVDANCLRLCNMGDTVCETPYSFCDIATSSNLNCYSGCGAGIWCYTGSAVGFKKQTAPFSFGDMAGYNHQAPTHVKDNISIGATIPSGGGNVSVHANLCFYETDFRDTFLKNMDAVKMKVTGSVTDSETITITDCTQQNGFEFCKNVFMSGAGTLCVCFCLTCDSIEKAPVPTIAGHSIPVTVNTEPYIGELLLDAALVSCCGAWSAVYDCGLSCVHRVNNTYSMICLGISNDGNNEPDVTRFNMELFRRCNGDKWGSVCSGFTITSSGFNINDDALGVDITFGDVIDFCLADA